MATRKSALRRDLCRSITDGTLYSVMVGVGESYLALFVLAAGLGEVAAGLVTTVPLLAGAVLQLIGPRAVRWLGTPRRWVVTCAAVQAASFAPLIVMAATGRVSGAAVFAAATVYWGGALACGSAWTTLIGGIVPERLRARFFARRSRMANLGILAGLVGGGLALEHGAQRGGPGSEMVWFAGLFLVAALCRGGSATFLWLHTETGPPTNHRTVRGWELLGRLRRGREGRFMLFLWSMTLGVQIAQPFFIPYMKERLAFSYDQVLVLLAVSFIAKSLSQTIFGRWAHRHGAMHLLWIGGVGIVPLSGLWLLSDSFWYLLAAQAAAGAMWGAYDLASFLLLMETTRQEERTSLWGTYQLCNAGAMVVGSLIGAKVLTVLGGGVDAYAVVFAASVAARLGTVAYLLRTREVLRRPIPVAIGVDAVRPSAGSIGEPLLASLPDTVAQGDRRPSGGGNP
jgi:MFS family permease